MEANKERKEADEQKKKDEEKLPTESSPYVQYDNLEEYKMKAYGAQGHQKPVDLPHHGGTTDAPTPSGADLTDDKVKDVDDRL